MSAALKIKVFDSKGTHLVPIAKSTATVGSASHCDLVLDHSSVQPEHVRVWCEGGRVWVQDLGGATGTTLNGIRLPHLKPMLVRELDVLKLGECPATLGLEPNMVRAPVVKNIAADEVTSLDIKPLAPVVPIVPNDPAVENKKGELEELSRELADLKLQLQMARLDKGSSDDLPRQLAALNEEVSRMSAERQKLIETFDAMDREKRQYKVQFDDKVAELKLKALRELKEQREQDFAIFESWKKDAVTKISQALRHTLEAKVKAARGYTREGILAWQDDFNENVRRIVLSSDGPPALNGSTSQMSTSTSTVVKSSTQIPRGQDRRRSKRSRSSEALWNRVALVAFGLGLFMTAVWGLSSYMRTGSNPRSVASRTVDAPPLEGPLTFAPQQTKDFKNTYTENVLYTLNYTDAEFNVDFRAAWLKELSRVAKSEWRVADSLPESIVKKEWALLKDLGAIRATIVTPDQQAQGVKRMQAREQQFTRELKEQLRKRASVDKFMRLKRDFYTRNQVYVVREKR